MYFTVNTPIKIEGKPYRPCICYEITGSAMELTVEKLCKEGKAQTHENFVFFCNGKPVEQKAKKFEAVEKPVKKAKTKKAEPKEEVAEELPSESYEAEEKVEVEETEDF